MGCGCLIALLGVTAPRIAIFVMWLFTDYMSRAYESFLIAFLGFLLLPYTTAFYALVYAPVDGVSGFGWIVVAFGVLLDLGSWFGGGRYGREYQARRV